MNNIFINVDSLSDLLTAKNEYGEKAKILAGGTDLVVIMKNKMMDPEVIISIRKVDELKGIHGRKNDLIIGSLTTHSEIEENSLIEKNYYPLFQAVYSLGSPQIRNLGTIGGNIGNASPSGDTIPPLYIMDAKIKLMSKNGERIIDINNFFKGPGKTILKDDEIIHSITIPKGRYTKKISGFYKVGKRNALAIGVVSVAWAIKKDTIRFSFGGASPTISTTEIKKNASKKGIEKEVLKAISPIDDIRGSKNYRRDVILNIVEKIVSGE